MIIAPSVLSLDYSKFAQQLQVVNDNCKWIHFDVMDGHFVPNLSFGPDIFKLFRKNSNLFMDVHLMVSDPEYFSNVFINDGADGITIHYECFDNVDECRKLLLKIKQKYIKVGLSIKPNTNVEDIVPLLDCVDLVLVMSVEPGYGGQKFMPSSLLKVEFLDKYRKENNFDYFIQIDGGINDNTGRRAIEAGCDVLVAGSYIFNGDIKQNIENLNNEKK